MQFTTCMLVRFVPKIKASWGAIPKMIMTNTCHLKSSLALHFEVKVRIVIVLINSGNVNVHMLSHTCRQPVAGQLMTPDNEHVFQCWQVGRKALEVGFICAQAGNALQRCSWEASLRPGSCWNSRPAP